MLLSHYSFGSITVDSTTYIHDIIIYPEYVQDNWLRDNVHLLKISDIKDIFEYNPVKLIIGTGYNGQMKIDPKTITELVDTGIDYQIVPTANAVRLYNETKDKSNLVAVLHLTC